MAHAGERMMSHYQHIGFATVVTILADMSTLEDAIVEVQPHYFFAPPRLFQKIQAQHRSSMTADERHRLDDALTIGAAVAARRATGAPLEPDLLARWELADAVLAPWMREEFDAVGARFDERHESLDRLIPALREMVGGAEVIDPQGRTRPFVLSPATARPRGEPLEVRVGVRGRLDAAKIRDAAASGVTSIVVSPWQIGASELTPAAIEAALAHFGAAVSGPLRAAAIGR